MLASILTAITPPRFDFDGLALLTGMTMPAFVAVVIALIMVVERLQQRRTAVATPRTRKVGVGSCRDLAS